MKTGVMILIFVLGIGCNEEVFNQVKLKQRVMEYENEYEEYFFGYKIDELKSGHRNTEFEVKRINKGIDRAVINIERVVIIRNFEFSDTINIEFVNKFKLTGVKRLFSNSEGTQLIYTTRDSLYLVTNMEVDTFNFARRNYKSLYGDWKYYSKQW